MLTVKENDRLTRVGPNTPMGVLMRRYWQPIAAAVELDDNPVKPVKLLGESLILYRDRKEFPQPRQDYRIPSSGNIRPDLRLPGARANTLAA